MLHCTRPGRVRRLSCQRTLSSLETMQFALVRSRAGFISGGLGLGPIFSGGPPVFDGSVTMQVASSVVLCLGGPLVTFGYLLVSLR